MAKRSKPKPKAPAVVDCGHAQCERIFEKDRLVSAVCVGGQARRLSAKELPPRAQSGIKARSRAVAALRALDLATFADVERRAGSSPWPGEEGPGIEQHDGYPTSLRSGPGTRGRAVQLCHQQILVAGNLVRCDKRKPCEDHPTPADNLAQIPRPEYSEPTGELAAAKADGELVVEVDGVPPSAQRFYDELRQGARHLEVALKVARALQHNARAGRDGVDQCICCEAPVSGAGEDRLKNGFDPRCAKAWERYRAEWTGAGAPDRMAFIRARRDAMRERVAS